MSRVKGARGNNKDGNRKHTSRNYNNHGGGRRNNLRKQRKPYFPSFISFDEMEHGVEKGTLFQGPLRINAKNRQQAFVTIEGLDIDVYLDGEMARNRGLNSDLVVLSLSEDRTTWKEQSNFGGEDDKLNKSSTRMDNAEQKALWCPRVAQNASQAFAPYRKRNGLELTNLAKEKLKPSTCTVRKSKFSLVVKLSLLKSDAICLVILECLRPLQK